MAGNPTRYKGSAASLSIGFSDSAKTDLTGIARGLDTFSIDEQEDSRDVPGGGDTATMQPLGTKRGNSSFSIDENNITGPLLHGKNGRRYYVDYGPEGNAAGSPKYSYEAIATISHSIEEGGVRRFNVTLSHDGLITEGTF